MRRQNIGVLTPRNLSYLAPIPDQVNPANEVPIVMRRFLMLQIFSVSPFTLIVLFLLITNTATSGINIPIHRRGGRFVKHEVANYTRLEDLLRQTESRYSRTYRDVGDNSLVRRWAPSGEIVEHDGLLAPLYDLGSWYCSNCLFLVRKLKQKQVCPDECWGAVSEPRS